MRDDGGSARSLSKYATFSESCRMKLPLLGPLLSPFLGQKAAQPAASSADAACPVPQAAQNHESAKTPCPAPPPETGSKLLKGVLDEAPAPEPVAGTRGSEPDPVPLSQRLSVGARLDDATRRTLENAARLVALADGETAQAISMVAEQLRKQACCVAFAGQVKAGKSSLINILVERPDFLPADINPCTAVVTRLNFGVADKPNSGALFTFFSREEWRRLSLGGQTRELTDRLFPDFDWEILKSQVAAMEERACEKLGPSFEELLGKTHFRKEVDANSLVRYVGVGHPDAQSPSECAEGEFSDITRSADIFLDLGAFTFPTILIDTPGVNDPFLVRDEITRQNLDAADICVVVVTARHPLSATDLNLLRMLRGLKKDRLIVFVNKSDELKGGEEVLQEVERRVSSILRKEFPGTNIPVIFGSAALARQALSGGSADPLLSNGTDAYPLNEDAARLRWPSLKDIANKARADELLSRSGLLSLASAISAMMDCGVIADEIRSATRLIEAVGRNLIAWLEIEANLLLLLPHEAGRTENELEAIAQLREELAGEFDSFSARLDAVHAQKVSLIKQKLSSAVHAFISEGLASLPEGDPATQASEIDVKLRMRLETTFVNAIEEIRSWLVNEQKILESQLFCLIEASSLTGNLKIILGQPLAFTPSLAALSEPAALGFTAHLRGLAGAPTCRQDQKVSLASLIVTDFSPIIERLGDEATKVFQERSCAFVSQAKALTFGPIDMVIKKVSLALAEAETQGARDVETNIRAIHEAITKLRLADIVL